MDTGSGPVFTLPDFSVRWKRGVVVVCMELVIGVCLVAGSELRSTPVTAHFGAVAVNNVEAGIAGHTITGFSAQLSGSPKDRGRKIRTASLCRSRAAGRLGSVGVVVHAKKKPRLLYLVQRYFVARLRLPANLVWHKERSHRHFLFSHVVTRSLALAFSCGHM